MFLFNLFVLEMKKLKPRMEWLVWICQTYWCQNSGLACSFEAAWGISSFLDTALICWCFTIIEERFDKSPSFHTLTVTYAVMSSTCYPLWYRHWMAAICPIGRLILLPARLRSFSVEWTDAGKTYLEGNYHINIYLQTWLALHSKCLEFYFLWGNPRRLP